MSAKDKIEISQEVYDLYDDYAHNKLDRREFMSKLSLYAVGGLTVSSLASMLLPNYAKGMSVKPGDSRISEEWVEYDSPKGAGKMKALLVKPAEMKANVPGIVVVHENRGLNPYVEDVARAAGVAGFMALAPDALTPFGGYPGTDDEGRTMQRKRDREKMLQDFIAGFYLLKDYDGCSGNVGVVGFCFGGWISNMMAVRVPELKAAVPFYGGQPSAEETAKIKAPMLLQYAGLDKRVNEGWPAYEEALKANNKEYTAYVYPDVNHGFHNYSTSRYNKEAAELAWSRTIAFFEEKLK